jgi:hypothetical protein
MLVVTDDQVMAANRLPEVANAPFLPFQSEMGGGPSDQQRRASAHCGISDADAICGSAESDLLLHTPVPQDLLTLS